MSTAPRGLPYSEDKVAKTNAQLKIRCRKCYNWAILQESTRGKYYKCLGCGSMFLANTL